MRSTIRVLVVDDSALVRQMLTRALSLDPRIEIVGVARTGVEAIEKARELAPDVITLDVEMPELTGIEALPHLRKHSDARVVMLSCIDDQDTTYQALSAGAVDFISKPKHGMATSIGDLAELLIKTIKTAYRIDPLRVGQALQSPGPAVTEPPPPPEVPESAEEPPPSTSAIVAIAASTGGPPALERVFSGLSSSIPAAYLVVQHLPPGFSTSLARRISSASDIEAVEAKEGMLLEPGRAYVAIHGAHMLIEPVEGGAAHRIVMDAGPALHGVRPAADPLFESVANCCGDQAIGVVLTGMGSDGAIGLRAIRLAGGDTIAQDEQTSVVWGMPGAAARIGAVRHTVPLGLVAAEIRRSMRARTSA